MSNIEILKTSTEKIDASSEELEEDRKRCFTEIEIYPDLNKYFEKTWLQKRVKIYRGYGDVIISHIANEETHKLLNILSTIEKAKGFSGVLKDLKTSGSNIPTWIEMKAAFLLLNLGFEPEFFEKILRGKKFGGQNPKLPDLKLITPNKQNIFCEVTRLREREIFQKLKKEKYNQGERVIRILSKWNKYPEKYLEEKIREKASQFRDYNPGILYIDFDRADHMFNKRSITKAAMEVWIKKHDNDNYKHLKNLIGIYSCNINNSEKDFWNFDDKDDRSKQLKDVLKID